MFADKFKLGLLYIAGHSKTITAKGYEWRILQDRHCNSSICWSCGLVAALSCSADTFSDAFSYASTNHVQPGCVDMLCV